MNFPKAIVMDELYKIKKLELLDLIKSNSSHFFDKREPNQLVGLLNQGATCYLNSLLQALNSDHEFLAVVFSQGSPHPIVKELQVLFASMAMSEHATISTKTLTSAFGISLLIFYS